MATERMPLHRCTNAARTACWSAAGADRAGSCQQTHKRGCVLQPPATHVHPKHDQAAPACAVELGIGLAALAQGRLGQRGGRPCVRSWLPVTPDRADNGGVHRKLLAVPKRLLPTKTNTVLVGELAHHTVLFATLVWPDCPFTCDLFTSRECQSPLPDTFARACAERTAH